MENIERKVCDWIDSHEKKAVRLLKKLVGEKSTLGEEFNAQAVVLEKLRQFDAEIDVWEPSIKQLNQHPLFKSDRTSFKESPNIAAVKRGSGGGKSLILNGHIDVVPAGNRNDWDIEPFQPIMKHGRIYGRGTTDMKGGNTALLMAIEALEQCGVRLKGDLIFQSVVDEECGGAGTLAAVMRGYRADGALIPEPTNMKIFIKQQGSMWFRITVKGLSAHGGTRYEGVSAIEKSMLVIGSIRQLESVRNKRIKDSLYEHIPIPVPINIGTIKGGAWPSSVADTVTLEGRCGIAPNESPEAVQAELENWLQDLQYHDDWFKHYPVEVEWFGARWMPNDLADDHELAVSLKNAYQNITGKQPAVEASPWATDGGVLSHAGDTPAIVFGPGETKLAHQANEYIEKDAMIKAAKIISLFIMNWCGYEK